jgi:hypothetical protein
VICGVLSDSILEKPGRLLEVPLYKRQHTECQRDVCILGFDPVRLEEPVADRVKIRLVPESRRQLREIRVILQPVVQMLDSLALLQLVRARNAEAQQRIQVERVDLVGLLKSYNRIVVLVVLLIELAHESPGLRVLRGLLDLSLEANDRLLSLSIFYKLLSDCDPIPCIFHVLVLGLHGYDSLHGFDLLLPLTAPLLSELRIEVLVHILLLPLLHHLVD